jgi:electron transport complex protein RnfD
VFVLTWLLGSDPLVQVLSGGLMLGAVFMATDYATCPINKAGKVVYAIGCGLITVLIRMFGSLPEGVSFAIVIMNILSPLIERATKPRPFGAGKAVRS